MGEVIAESLLGKLIFKVYTYVIPFQLLPFACFIVEVIPDSDVVNVL